MQDSVFFYFGSSLLLLGKFVTHSSDIDEFVADWNKQYYVDFETAKKLHDERSIGFDLCWLPWNGKSQLCIFAHGKRLSNLFPDGKHRIHQDSIEKYEQHQQILLHRS
jgi:hypothetical protein